MTENCVFETARAGGLGFHHSLDRWIGAPSWKFQPGVTTADDLDRDLENSLYFKANLGVGPAIRIPLAKHTFLYGMAELDRGWERFFATPIGSAAAAAAASL